jgi:hypothetical protein
MGFWNNLTSLFTGIRATKDSNGEFFYMIGGGSGGSTWAFENPKNYIDAYVGCPPLSATIGRLGQYTCAAKEWVLNVNDDDEAKGEFADNIRRLLRKPNILQSWKKFKYQYNVFKRLFGYCPVLVVNPSGFKGLTSKTSLWILPPWCVDIKLTGKYYSATETKDLVESITFTYGRQRSPMEIDNIILLTDFSFGIDNQVLPASRAKNLAYPIATVVNGLRSGNTLIKKKGGIGILSNGAKDSVGHIPMLPADKKEVQDSLGKYGLSEDQSEIIVTNANLNWQPMTYDAGQLKIPESVALASQMIADEYGFNVMLLSQTQNATFSNIRELKREVYQTTVIPEDENDAQVFEEHFKCRENNVRFVVDYTGVEAMQQNKKDVATARQTMTNSCRTEFFSNVITLNQWLKNIEEEEITGGHGDKYYHELVTLGWSFDNKPQPIAQQETAEAK